MYPVLNVVRVLFVKHRLVNVTIKCALCEIPPMHFNKLSCNMCVDKIKW